MTLVIVFGKSSLPLSLSLYCLRDAQILFFHFSLFFLSLLPHYSVSLHSSLVSYLSLPFHSFSCATTAHIRLPLHLHLSLPSSCLPVLLTRSFSHFIFSSSHLSSFLLFHFSLCSVLEPVLCLGPPSSVRIHSADPANHCNLYFHTESRSTQLSSQSTDLLTLYSKYS